MAIYLLPDGTTIIETGTAVYPVLWGTVVERELTSEPLALPDYPDIENESPYEQDEAIVTVEATGGSTPYSYAITAQSTTAGMLKVTGTLDPDATGIYVENGTHNSEPAYERTDGAYWIWYDGTVGRTWVLSPSKASYQPTYWYRTAAGATGEYSKAGGGNAATVANATPFQINSSTGEITIADASGLAVGQTWTLTVQATDAASATDAGTVTVELVAAIPTATIGVININKGITYRYNTTPILGALASRRA